MSRTFRYFSLLNGGTAGAAGKYAHGSICWENLSSLLRQLPHNLRQLQYNVLKKWPYTCVYIKQGLSSLMIRCPRVVCKPWHQLHKLHAFHGMDPCTHAQTNAMGHGAIVCKEYSFGSHSCSGAYGCSSHIQQLERVPEVMLRFIPCLNVQVLWMLQSFSTQDRQD